MKSAHDKKKKKKKKKKMKKILSMQVNRLFFVTEKNVDMISNIYGTWIKVE